MSNFITELVHGRRNRMSKLVCKQILRELFVSSYQADHDVIFRTKFAIYISMSLSSKFYVVDSRIV